jgi:hypothetical protein
MIPGRRACGFRTGNRRMEGFASVEELAKMF